MHAANVLEVCAIFAHCSKLGHLTVSKLFLAAGTYAFIGQFLYTDCYSVRVF